MHCQHLCSNADVLSCNSEHVMTRKLKFRLRSIEIHSARTGRRDVAAGEQATRVPQLGISNYSEPLYWCTLFLVFGFT